MIGTGAPAWNAPRRAKCIHRCRLACSCRVSAEGVVAAMRQTYRSGMALVYDRRGEGDALVLLHGIGSRWQVFEPVIDLLAAEFDVIAVDMPGFGASGAPAVPLRSIRSLTDAVEEWIGSLGIEGDVHVAGNSTGAGVALELASRGVVASCCALAPIGFWSARERAWCQMSVRNSRALSKLMQPAAPALLRFAALRTLFFAQYSAKPAAIAPEVALGDLDALIGAAAFDDVCAAFTGYLAPADAADHVPVTIAWGDKDRLLLPRQLNRARSRVPRARHVLVPGVGHLMMGDDPAAVAEVIRAATRAAAPVPA